MWFSVEEYESRLARAQEVLRSRGYDHALLFEPENITYLTGFFTEGYNTSFQLAVLPAEGRPTVVARIEEKYWFEQTSPWPDHVIWWHDGEEPAEIVLRALKELGVTGGLAVEGGSWRAPYTLVRAVEDERPDMSIGDIGLELSRLRFVKSEAELALIARAGRSVEAMCAAAASTVRPGVSERDIAIAVSAAGIRTGSDWADPGPISSGEAARHIHAGFADRVVEADDLVFVEATAHVKHYHARCMRTIKVGEPGQAVRDTYRALMDVQDEALASVRAGVHCGVPDRIYRQGILGTGAVSFYPNKTFYGVGLLLHPNTLEPLEVNPASDFVFESGMVFHTYMTVDGLNLSDTIVVTDGGYERLTNYPRDLIVV